MHELRARCTLSSMTTQWTRARAHQIWEARQQIAKSRHHNSGHCSNVPMIGHSRFFQGVTTIISSQSETVAPCSQDQETLAENSRIDGTGHTADCAKSTQFESRDVTDFHASKDKSPSHIASKATCESKLVGSSSEAIPRGESSGVTTPR